MKQLTVLFLSLGILLAFAPGASAQKFHPDDPLWNDPDNLAISEPLKLDQSELYDFLLNSLSKPCGAFGEPAANTNTLDEVPDSSWFTNRIGRYQMSLEELARGPNRGTGPDLSRPLTIVIVKSQGITPGFAFRDSRNDLYFVKVDPLHYPQLTTSAEVISTKFFHAMGYNVPENYLVYLKPSNLRIGPGALIQRATGRKQPMTQKDLDAMLKKTPRRADGSIQVIASLSIPGKLVGSFKYCGTRPDDANDIFPHEDRRELRAMYIFAAWLNHFDTRFVNSKDAFVATDGKLGYIKHYLFDFGSTLGSRGIEPQKPRTGYEYIIEWGPIFKSAATFGIADRYWRHIPYPDYPSVGRYEADHFDPAGWKTGYPNPALLRMQNTDAFWAARIVHKFTDERIRAIVKTGELADPRAEAYLEDVLIQRRDKIVRYYFDQINPLDDIHIADGSVRFNNLGVDAGLAGNANYECQWFRFDNETSKAEPLGSPSSSASPSLAVPQDPASYLLAQIRTISAGHPNWRKMISVYVRNAGDKAVVGIEREN